MVVLGISAFFHDSAAALVVDGQVVAAAQEERFSRQKHDASLPVEAVAFCLEQAGLTIEDVDEVVFYEKPLRKFERLLVTQLRTFPRGLGQFVRSMGSWLGQRLWLKGQIAATLGCPASKILFCEHHMSHAASAWLCSGFDRATVVTADGVGEWATAGIYRGVCDAQGSRLELLQELHFPHSMGLLYSAITAYLGFRVNNGEYKVMGLASWGEPRFQEAFDQLCTVDDDGAITLDMRFFAFDRDPERSFTAALETLLGPARQPDSPLELPATPGTDAQRWADVAATLQALCEAWMLKVVAHAAELTGEGEALCMAGGVALNSVANGRIATESGFEHVFVQPAAGDAGGALGAALYVSHVVHGEGRPTAMPHAFLGRAYEADAVEETLQTWRVRYERFESDDALAAHVAERLDRGEVGGWFQGRFEWGPRSLGARSILADPRRPDMIDRVNRLVKLREGFRPFAPAVLADEAARWFDMLPPERDHLTPWMLSVVPVREGAREALPAVTHVDGTARVQTVREESNPRFAGLLRAFRDLTGVGVLLNTSMNLKGEPMCSTPAEAYSVFERSGLDFLVLERCVVTRKRRRRGATTKRAA